MNENSGVVFRRTVWVSDFGGVKRTLNGEKNFEWVEGTYYGWGEFVEVKRIVKH